MIVLELQLLPARQGDAIWIRWRDGRLVRQMIVDMGTGGVGADLRKRLAALPDDRRRFELLVITHIDADHIGGVLACLVDPRDAIPALAFDDVWFNGLDHLEAAARPRTLEEQGGVQGQRLMTWLEGQRWNAAFRGGRVCRAPRPRTVTLAGDLSLTVLGPTPQRLAELAPSWREEVRRALARRRAATGAGTLEALGRARPARPRLGSHADLAQLAARSTGGDDSKANGSSIVLLLQYRGRRILLAGDAFAQDIVAGIAALGETAPLRLDAFKLPHHGSRDNTTREMLDAVDCRLFLFSSDGTLFQHPHAEAVACVIAGAGRRRRPELGFNARSEYTGWWGDPVWQRRFRYTARFGDGDGLSVRFRPRR